MNVFWKDYAAPVCRSSKLINERVEFGLAVDQLIGRHALCFELKERVVIGDKRDNTIAGRMLRYLWRSFLEGAAMYGAAMHGWPKPEHFQTHVVRQVDKE